MRRNLFTWLVLVCLVPEPSLLARENPTNQKLRIVYFSPNSPGNTYWPQVFEVMREVAHDLDVEFVPYDLGVRKGSYSLVDAAVQILDRERKPDAIITSAIASEARHILDKAEAHRVPVFMQGPLYPHEMPKIGGGPRQKYKYWIGYFRQDDFKKGLELGRLLLKRARDAKAFASDGKIHVLGIGGQQSWFGSTLRENGLKAAVSEDKDAVLGQIVPTDWTIEEGREKVTRMLNRFPETSVIWASSDTLAIAAAEVLEKKGKILGKTAFTGGLDMSAVGLQQVKSGRLEGTVSATHLLFAQVLVSIYDYIKRRDFRDQGLEIIPPTYVVTRDNAEQFMSLMNRIRETDFRTFSRVLNKDRKNYDFSIESLSSQGAVKKPSAPERPPSK